MLFALSHFQAHFFILLTTHFDSLAKVFDFKEFSFAKNQYYDALRN